MLGLVTGHAETLSSVWKNIDRSCSRSAGVAGVIGPAGRALGRTPMAPEGER